MVGFQRQGMALWRQVGNSVTSRVFEVYDLLPSMPESDEQIRIATIRDRGAKLRHPGLRESGIE